jgi:hypothetical protein
MDRTLEKNSIAAPSIGVTQRFPYRKTGRDGGGAC